MNAARSQIQNGSKNPTCPSDHRLLLLPPLLLHHHQAEDVVSFAELARWRSTWAAAAEAQFQAAVRGDYKESAAQFLTSSWQRDALAVRTDTEIVTACADGQQGGRAGKCAGSLWACRSDAAIAA